MLKRQAQNMPYIPVLAARLFPVDVAVTASFFTLQARAQAHDGPITQSMHLRAAAHSVLSPVM